VLLKDPEFHCG